MIVDANKQGDLIPTSADVVIVGAGAVGILMAVALLNRGFNVVVLESGGQFHEVASQKLNDASVIGRPHNGIHEGRARVLGGTTSLWGGQLTKFTSSDFEERSWIPESGWPLVLRELIPYYLKVGEILGLDPTTFDDDDLSKAVGIQDPFKGSGLVHFYTRWLQETNFSRKFSQELNSEKLLVLTHCHAVSFNNDGPKIVGVSVRNQLGVDYEIKAENFVVAAGTLESIRLMLNAARSNPSLSWADNEYIGKGFQDHLDFKAAKVLPTDKRFFNIFDNIYYKKRKYQPKVRVADEFQCANKMANIACSISFESSFREHIDNIKVFVKAIGGGGKKPPLQEILPNIKALGKIWFPLIKRYLIDKRAFNVSDKGIFVVLHCEQYPLLRSSVRLDLDTRDVYGVPRIVLDWQLDGRELETMRKFCIKLEKEFADSNLATLEIDPRLTNSDPAVFDGCRDTNHQCGGLRMTFDHQRNGVVDKHLKVLGSDNIYVAGACVFPTSSFANPTFTAMALALRLVDQLERERADKHC